MLKDITAGQAAAKVFAGWNSIRKIANHIIEWKLNVLKRVQGEVIITPDHNYVKPITKPTKAEWKNTLKRLEETQKKWISFLKKFKEKDFGKIYKIKGLSYYDHIHGIMQHDAYHTGQIALLIKRV